MIKKDLTGSYRQDFSKTIFGEEKMSLQTQFNKFNETISLSWQDGKIKSIREKNDSILEDIKEKFKEEGYAVVDSFKQGSYITNTTVEPLDKEYDIDVGIVIDYEKAPENPIDTKKTLRDVLHARNFKEPKIKKPCVTAQYLKAGEKSFHLDYPIYKKNKFNTYYLAVGKEYSNSDDRKWEESDPKGLIEWLNDYKSFRSNEAYLQYKRLIRYMKRWRDYCISETERKKIYSIGLAIMIKESFIMSISNDGDINDVTALLNTVKNIKNKYFKCVDNINNKYKVKVNIPVKPYRDVFDKHGSSVGTLFYNKLDKLLENIDAVNKEDSSIKKCEILRKSCFGDDFPVPDKENNDAKIFKEAGYISSPQGA